MRQDHRQWLIYQEEPVTNVVSILEAFLVGLGAQTLLRHPEQAMRAMGHFGARLAETRMAHWAGQLRGLEPTDGQREMVSHLRVIAQFLAGEGPRPDTELDEVHAALVWLDKRAKDAGVSGPGWYREIVRDSTLGR
jgi:hypothetical protein